jgi:hypothetical protein
MTSMQAMNWLVVYGGRIDTPGMRSVQNFSDIHILAIKTMTWESVQAFGLPPSPRSGHCAASIGTTMYVFGGL